MQLRVLLAALDPPRKRKKGNWQHLGSASSTVSLFLCIKQSSDCFSLTCFSDQHGNLCHLRYLKGKGYLSSSSQESC